MSIASRRPWCVLVLLAVLASCGPGSGDETVAPDRGKNPLRFDRAGRSESLLCALLEAAPRPHPDSGDARTGSCGCDAGAPPCTRIDVGDDRRPALVLEPGTSIRVPLRNLDGTQVRFAAAVLGARPAVVQVRIEITAGDAPIRRWTRRLTGAAPWTDGALDLPNERTATTALSITAGPVAGVPGDALVAIGAPRVVRPRGRRGTRGPTNLLVYLVDTLRPDHLSAYGYRRDTSPVLRALAARGVLFENAYSTAAWTRPATASLLTGLHAGHHGVHSRSALREDIHTLAERIRAAGWSTWAFVANGHVFDASLGFDQGFDRFVAIRGIRTDTYARSEEVNAAVIPHVTAIGDEPFFLYVHVADPHSPYDPPPGYRGLFTDPAYAGSVGPKDMRRGRLRNVRLDAADIAHVRALYDEDIRYQDAMLGVLLEHLDALGLGGDTAVLVVSDHGEEFFDHGDWEHGARLFQEQIRIPFILTLPGVPGLAGRRVGAPVQLIDVVPTVLSWFGLDEGPATDGRDLMPQLAATGGSPLPASRPIFCEELRLERRLELQSLIEAPWKVIRRRHLRTGDETWALYDLAADPAEQTDRTRTAPATFEALRERLLARIGAGISTDAARAVVPARLDEQTRAQLVALGYGNAVGPAARAGVPPPRASRHDQSPSMLRRPGPTKSSPKNTTANSSAWE